MDETNQEQRESQKGQSLERPGMDLSKLYAGKIEDREYLLSKKGQEEINEMRRYVC